MKLMSARSMRAPAPFIRQNRAPAILAPRSKSRMSSPVPMSTWSRTGKENGGGSPKVRTVGLSSSPSPSGTDASGTLGRETSTSSIRRSMSGSPASASLIRPETSFIRSIRAEASFFSLRRRPISSDAAFLSARSPSTATIVSRRTRSSSSNPARVIGDLRRRSASRTASMFSRTNFTSSIGVPPVSSP